MIEATVLGAFFFGILGFVGVQLGNAVAERLEALPDSPEPFDTPVPVLLAGCAIVGALTVPHAASIAQVAIVGIPLLRIRILGGVVMTMDVRHIRSAVTTFDYE